MLAIVAPVVHREDVVSALPALTTTTRLAHRRRRHSISTSTPLSKLLSHPTMADRSPAPPLARAPSAATLTSTLTLPMPTPSSPTPTTRKMAADLRRHSFRIASASTTTPFKPVASTSSSSATTPARSPVKVLCAATAAVRIPSASALKSVPAKPVLSSTPCELPILRFQYVARDVRVSIGSSWKLPRTELKNIRLFTGAEPFVTVFCSATTTKFVLPADTTLEQNLDTLKLKSGSSSSSSSLRMKLRFATAADASIWRRLVDDALTQATWRRDHEDVACLAQDAATRVVVARHVTRATPECVIKTHLRTRVEDVAEVTVLRKLVPLAASHAALSFLREYRVVETARDVEIVMPRHAGATLLAFLSTCGATKAMRETDARRVVEQICETLHALHANGFVHCDLKLENVVVTNDCSDVCVIDFGGAYDRHQCHSDTPVSSMVGTPGYIAPERILNANAPPTPAADLFSLGVLLYQMLVGEHPYAKAQAARRRLTIDDSLALDWAHMARRLQARNVSLEAQRLVAQLVAADPCERITLNQVFNHAWLSNQHA